MHLAKKLFAVFTTAAIVLSSLSLVVTADVGPEQICRVKFNGATYSVYCAGTAELGLYVTTRGDLKYINCKLPNEPVAFGCTYVE